MNAVTLLQTDKHPQTFEDVKRLPFTTLKDRKNLPAKSGVYFVTSMSCLLYIGKTINLLERWHSFKHHRTHQFSQFRNVCIHYICRDEIDEFELECINHFQTPLNGMDLPYRYNEVAVNHLEVMYNNAKRTIVDARRDLYFLKATIDYMNDLRRQALLSRDIPLFQKRLIDTLLTLMPTASLQMASIEGNLDPFLDKLLEDLKSESPQTHPTRTPRAPQKT